MNELVTSSGSVASQFTYDLYGNRTTVSGTVIPDIGYAGYFYHAVSGIDFALYRAYDPVHARWLNRDPIGEAGGINLYAYSRSSPLTYTDASGLVANPVELTCVDPVQPACWLGVLADIATGYGLFVASAGAEAVALATPGDVCSSRRERAFCSCSSPI